MTFTSSICNKSYEDTVDKVSELRFDVDIQTWNRLSGTLPIRLGTEVSIKEESNKTPDLVKVDDVEVGENVFAQR